MHVRHWSAKIGCWPEFRIDAIYSEMRDWIQLVEQLRKKACCDVRALCWNASDITDDFMFCVGALGVIWLSLFSFCVDGYILIHYYL